MPDAVRAAFALQGDKFRNALRAALAALPQEQAAATLQQLRDAGLISGGAEPDLQQLLAQFEPLLAAVAAAASDESQRPELETKLAELETKNWMLLAPARRIWAGERDAAMLTAGLDAQDAALVRRVLELLEG